MTQQTPILILLFNRPENTRALLTHLAVQQPRKLYVGCDGPRNETEAILVNKVHQAVSELVTWPCEIQTRYRSENLGLRVAVTDALNWFFESEEMGIILEDDCMPAPAFFEFASGLLRKYAKDERVMHISGNNLDISYSESSYYGSKYPRVWGWATWKRAWNQYTDSDAFLKSLTNERMKELYPRSMDRAFWQLIVEKMRLENSNLKNRSWAYFWALCIRNANGICLQSSQNLIQNVGFGEDATNTTRSERLKTRSGKASSENNRLVHPEQLEFDEKADNRFVDSILIDSRIRFLKVLLKRFFPFLKPRR